MTAALIKRNVVDHSHITLCKSVSDDIHNKYIIYKGTMFNFLNVDHLCLSKRQFMRYVRLILLCNFFFSCVIIQIEDTFLFVGLRYPADLKIWGLAKKKKKKKKIQRKNWQEMPIPAPDLGFISTSGSLGLLLCPLMEIHS